MGARKRGEGLLHLAGEASDVGPQLSERGRGDATVLLEERLQEVFSTHLGMIGLLRHGLGGSQGLLGLYSELIEPHGYSQLPYMQKIVTLAYDCQVI